MIVMIVKYTTGFYHNEIAKAVRQLGEECVLHSWMNFDAGVIDKLSPKRDIVFLRTGARKALAIARNFESRGFKVLNDSRFINISSQKFIANLYARSNSVPVPALCVAVDKKDPDILRGYLRQYGVLVAKPIYSRDMGRFVYKINKNTMEDDLKLVETIPGDRVMLQSEIEFVNIVRTIVIGDKMLVEATTYDTKHPPDWKATLCMNPRAKHYVNVPGKLIDLAERTNVVFGGDVAYIDYFEQESGDYVLSEINHSCGLQHHEAITGVPIHKHIGRYLVDHHRELLFRSRDVRAAA
jgi:glutathione synthase/RimK-type ligase-like ATP-grasp enzyme